MARTLFQQCSTSIVSVTPVSAGLSCPHEIQMRLAHTFWGNAKPSPRFLLMFVLVTDNTWEGRERITSQQCNFSEWSLGVPVLKVPLTTHHDFAWSPISHPLAGSSLFSLPGSAPRIPHWEKKNDKSLVLSYRSNLTISFSCLQRLSLLWQGDLLFSQRQFFPKREKNFICTWAFGKNEVVLILYSFIQHMCMEQLICARHTSGC